MTIPIPLWMIQIWICLERVRCYNGTPHFRDSLILRPRDTLAVHQENKSQLAGQLRNWFRLRSNGMALVDHLGGHTMLQVLRYRTVGETGTIEDKRFLEQLPRPMRQLWASITECMTDFSSLHLTRRRISQDQSVDSARLLRVA